MDSPIRSWFSRRKWLLVAASLPVLIGAWVGFPAGETVDQPKGE